MRSTIGWSTSLVSSLAHRVPVRSPFSGVRKSVVGSFTLTAKLEDQAFNITRRHLERYARHEPLKKRESVRKRERIRLMKSSAAMRRSSARPFQDW